MPPKVLKPRSHFRHLWFRGWWESWCYEVSTFACSQIIGNPYLVQVVRSSKVALALGTHVVFVNVLPVLIIVKPEVSDAAITALTDVAAVAIAAVLQQIAPVAAVFTTLRWTLPML